jgi:Skp family chaperone for outer membrane proteins
MKKILFIFLLSCSFGLPLMAQENLPDEPAKREQKIKALYVAYMTQELKLSEEEAQKFWPIHGQFETELKGLKADMPELDKQQAILNIKKKYQDRFQKVLGNNRTDDFYRKDNEFRKRMVERLRNIRQQQQNNGGGGRPFRRGGGL